jgi:dTDP-4-amino-4,6-dideoxygalactose transaminase
MTSHDIAKIYNKAYGFTLYSGTLAIVAALKLLGARKGDKVLIPSSCCYSVYQAVINADCIPVVMIPSFGVLLSAKDIKYAFSQTKFKYAIAIHQYGLAQDISIYKKISPNIKVIEDIAQAWKLIINNEITGEYSDCIITSMGETKPLSYGVGGLLFSNDDYSEKIDFHDSISRSKKGILIPSAYPLSKEFPFEELISKADSTVEYQRAISKEFDKMFSKMSINIFKDEENNNSVWHRYPLFFNNQSEMEDIIKFLDKNNILYQKEFKAGLEKLEMVKSTTHIVLGKKGNKKMLLLKTKQNDIKKIKKLNENS